MMNETEWTPKVGDEVTYPTGRGVVQLSADQNGVLIVSEDGKWKRVAVNACSPVPTTEDKAVEAMMEHAKWAGTDISRAACKSMARELYRVGYRQVQTSEKCHLQWVYDRLWNVHGEDRNVDYMIRFKEIIDKLS